MWMRARLECDWEYEGDQNVNEYEDERDHGVRTYVP